MDAARSLNVNITKRHFGTTADGVEVYLYTLTDPGGLNTSITTYGGAITSLNTLDRNGTPGDIVLGYETLAEYARNPRYFGALIGRHANRLAKGRFSLNGSDYQLEQNNGANHLHGGSYGFDKRVWTACEGSGDFLRLSYLSKDGEEGYPGDLRTTVDFTLSENELRLEYRAMSDADTIVNLSNHSYFNLKGAGTILDHELTLLADSFTPVSCDLIPTGEVRSVVGTPMDFRCGKCIEKDIAQPYDQLRFTGGYDHNFVLRDYDRSLRLAARLYEATTGRIVELFTTQPGLQFYSGNFLDGSLVGKKGVAYAKYSGLCLEPQYFPDAPHHQNFPSTVLCAGEEYKQTTVFRFSTE